MGLLSWLLGRKKDKREVKEFDKRDFFPQTPMPTRMYNKSIQESKSDDDWWEREKRRREQQQLYDLNSGYAIDNFNQPDSGNTPPHDTHNDYGGGSFGGGGSSSDWSGPGYDSGSSSSDSSSSDSGSSDSGGGDSGGGSSD